MENKLQKKTFSLVKKDWFFVDLCVHFEPLQARNVHTYATTKELKEKAFRINSQYIKQAMGIKVNKALFHHGNEASKITFFNKI